MTNQLTRQAYERYQEAVDNGILTDSEEELIKTIEYQEIVTYCKSTGSVMFDVDDVEWLED